MKPILAVIPAYNLGEMTAQCVRALEASADLVDVVVIDNGSDSDERALLDLSVYRFPGKAGVIGLDRNRGFTAAVNAGLEFRASHQHALILNNDCFVGPQTVSRLLRHLDANPATAACGPMTDGPGIHSLRKGRRTTRFLEVLEAMPDIAAAENALARIAPGEVVQSNMIAFFCSLLRSRALNELGTLDERFADGLGADDEWCARARRRGWKVEMVVDAFASHLGKTTFRTFGMARNCTKAYRLLGQVTRRAR